MTPRPRWDEPWRRYPASRPLPAPGGLAPSRRRGAIGEAWWSRRFVDVLESFGLGGRMARGRRYARAGQVLTLDVTSGLLVGQVQGSRRTPYVVTVRAPQLSAEQWSAVDVAMRARIGFAARLLAGEVPHELDQAFASAGVELIPSRWPALGAHCTCPDDENPCKHIAAVLYLFADRLDADPWLLLAWRGRTRDEVLAHLHGAVGAGAGPELPPWWPLVPGPVAAARPAPVPAADPPDPPDAALARLAALDAEVAGRPVVELLAAAYGALFGAGAGGEDAPRRGGRRRGRPAGRDS